MAHRSRSITMSLASILIAAGALPALAEPFELRISGENPASGSDLIMAQRFADNLKETLGEDFTYEFFHTQALGNEVVHMQMIRSGQIDVYPMGSDAIQLDPNWAVFDIPFLFSDRETVARVLDGEIGEELRASMREAAGLELLAFGEIGFRQITNNTRPIVKPEDLTGVRIRVPGSRARVLAFTTYGAAPVSMNLGELYLALQNGTVDGQENPVRTTMSFSLHEVQDYMSISNHVYTPVTLVMNGAKFDGLTPEQQTAVKEAAQEAALFSRSDGEKTDGEALATLRAAGEVEINDIDLAAFQDISKPVWEDIGATMSEGFLDRILAAANAQ